jgi:plasmid stabilization system protein ParE
MTFKVEFAAAAGGDLLRLFDYLLERATTTDDLLHAERVVESLRAAILGQLASSPWTCRKAGDGKRSTRRELIVPCGKTGYVALFEIEGPERVLVLAVRHQLEDDYH